MIVRRQRRRGRGEPGKASKAAGWADERLGLAKASKSYLRKVFPDHWSFMLGEIALWSFVVLLVTGVFLTLWFRPAMGETTYSGSYDALRGLKVSEAYASTLHLSFDVRGGLLMRQTHHWAANVFIAAMFVHMMRVFVTGAFRKPREVNWVIGSAMLLLGILEGFAGYSLPDDLLSGTGLRIAEGLMQSIPVIGSYVVFFVFGGQFPGDAIVSRLFTIHVLLIPGLLIALIGAHMLILVYQKHTQWPGPGRTNRNVVGYPMFPVYMAKSGGFFFVVFATVLLMGAFMTINPIWEYGPYDPAKVTADSQPDWYMGLPEGLLRIMPGYETHLLGHTISWNVLIPGVVMPMVLFLTFISYPFVASWVSGDRREHHLLQRPREAPNRVAFLAAMVTLYGLLWAAGGDDVIALVLHLDVNSMVELFRGAVFIGPVVAFIVTRRWCLGLQRHDRERVVEGRETGIVSRSPSGGYSERHEPLPVAFAYRLTTREASPEAPASDDAGSRRERWRRRLRTMWFGDTIPSPSAAELREAGYESVTRATGEQTPHEGSDPADGHQFDGRDPVRGHELRRH
jgi:ubiquinol-cytochrome c reductase cytochrome b subunit